MKYFKLFLLNFAMLPIWYVVYFILYSEWFSFKLLPVISVVPLLFFLLDVLKEYQHDKVMKERRVIEIEKESNKNKK